VKTSEQLAKTKIYTREDLKQQFSITDATINTGIFQPNGHKSIWLFVTETKSIDMTQYKDKLVGDTLYWDGQTSGRKDQLIINHKEQGLELLVFYRKSKQEFPGAGFEYLGAFEYDSHTEGSPSHFILCKKRI